MRRVSADRGHRRGRAFAAAAGRVGAVVLTLLLVAVLLVSGWAVARVAGAAWSGHDEAALAASTLRDRRGVDLSDPLPGQDQPGQASQDQIAPDQAPQDQTAPDQAPQGQTTPDTTGEPAGGYLEVALLGLANAQDVTRASDSRLADARAYLGQLDDARDAAPDSERAVPPDGPQMAGWRLLLATQVARLSGTSEDRQRVRGDAAEIVAALRASPIGILGASQGGSSPVDTVVAVGALREADRWVGVPDARETIAAWLRQVEPLRDGGSQLLPHRIDGSGRVLQGPRASSQALIQVFWPAIDPDTSSRDWAAFENIFPCPRLGLIVACEYPGGGEFVDADSGHLIAGVSPRSTLVTLAAARAHGNADLAREISREAELWGLSEASEAHGGRPPLNVVLAWARRTPVAQELPGVDDRAPVPWVGLLLVALVPGVLAFSVLTWRLVSLRRQLAGPLDVDAEPPFSPGPRTLRS